MLYQIGIIPIGYLGVGGIYIYIGAGWILSVAALRSFMRKLGWIMIGIAWLCFLGDSLYQGYYLWSVFLIFFSTMYWLESVFVPYPFMVGNLTALLFIPVCGHWLYSLDNLYIKIAVTVIIAIGFVCSAFAFWESYSHRRALMAALVNYFKTRQPQAEFFITKEYARRLWRGENFLSWFYHKFHNGGQFSEIHAKFLDDVQNSNKCCNEFVNRALAELDPPERMRLKIWARQARIWQQTAGVARIANIKAAIWGGYANAATTNVIAAVSCGNAVTAGNWAAASTMGGIAHAMTAGYKAEASTMGKGAYAMTAGYGAAASTMCEGAYAITAGESAEANTMGEGAYAMTAGEGAAASTMG
ncbi:MAG: hypothetical protein LBH31_02875, partial [Burkholderiaceae bacterium]|nr:hypothetical protein [Burkholderiaceae bacterium]